MLDAMWDEMLDAFYQVIQNHYSYIEAHYGMPWCLKKSTRMLVSVVAPGEG